MRPVDGLALAVRVGLSVLVAADLLVVAGLAFEPLEEVPASAVPGRLPPEMKVGLLGQWHGTLHEETLKVFMHMLFGTRDPHDLAIRHNFAYDKYDMAHYSPALLGRDHRYCGVGAVAGSAANSAAAQGICAVGAWPAASGRQLSSAGVAGACVAALMR